MSYPSKAWFSKMAELERELGVDVAAGPNQLGWLVAQSRAMSRAEPHAADDTKIVFGRFIQLMRRKRGLTVETLAESADVELDELLVIEDDVGHRPDLQTVHQLATFFQVPTQPLLQVAGLISARDPGLLHEGVRFAARSNPVNALSPEEREALDTFVAVLKERG